MAAHHNAGALVSVRGRVGISIFWKLSPVSVHKYGGGRNPKKRVFAYWTPMTRFWAKDK